MATKKDANYGFANGDIPPGVTVESPQLRLRFANRTYGSEQYAGYSYFFYALNKFDEACIYMEKAYLILTRGEIFNKLAKLKKKSLQDPSGEC